MTKNSILRFAVILLFVFLFSTARAGAQTLTPIHDVQGNGAATPIPGATVTVQGVVIGNFQGTGRLQGFFLQEEDAEADADPNTSEGIFIFCGACSTAVAEGQRVRATGAVSEFFGMTEITASTAGSVLVNDAGNHLAEVTPASITLPVAGDLNAFYEAREGMRVTYTGALSAAETADLPALGQILLYQGARPHAFTDITAPGAAGYSAYLDDLARRQAILDDDNDAPAAYLTQANGSQTVFYPRANGGFSVGTQGTDFFRAGDTVNNLTGILHWSTGGTAVSAWRIRPSAATPAVFTVANPRPAAAPAVGGALKAAYLSLGNYFTTIDTTASTTTGPCGPSGTQECRGADSTAELNRQRERTSIEICTIGASVLGLTELENTTPSATITDLLGAVNARCGGANPYAFVNTGGTIGTDAIRVQLIYRTGILSPVGAPLVDLNPAHDRPPTAQTFDLVDASNPRFGERFTIVVVHARARTCDAGATGTEADAGDGQGCYNARRTAQSNRLLTWINSTVVPAAGDPDVLIVGNFNAYPKENPITALTAGGYNDTLAAFTGTSSYSAVTNGQFGRLDLALTSANFAFNIAGAANWHINADESSLFDYNDEIRDTGEAVTEEKPDGSALVPPRVVYQPASVYRASDRDPVVIGLYSAAPTAAEASLSGRVLTAGGKGIANARVEISGSGGGIRSVTTNAFGNFTVDRLAAGETYLVSVSAKKYVFAPQVLTVTDDVAGLVFVGQ